LHPARAEPTRCGLDERLGGFLIIDRIEEPKEAGLVLMDFEVGAIDLSGAPADALPIAPCRKEDRLRMIKIRIFLGIQTISQIEFERRDIRAVLPIDAILQSDEIVQFISRSMGADLDRHARRSFGPSLKAR